MANALYTGKTGFNGARILTSLKPQEQKPATTNALRVGSIPQHSGHNPYEGGNGDRADGDHAPQPGDPNSLGDISYEGIGTLAGMAIPLPGASLVGKAIGSHIDEMKVKFDNATSDLANTNRPTFDPLGNFFNDIRSVFDSSVQTQTDRAVSDRKDRDTQMGRDVNRGDGLGGQRDGADAGSKGGVGGHAGHGGFGPSF